MTTTTTLFHAPKNLNRSLFQTQESNTRSFYHFAAALAHRDSDALMGSALLESDYQDCLLSFSARGQRLDFNKAKNQVINALNKFLISHDQTNININNLNIKSHKSLLEQPENLCSWAGLSYAPDEIAALVLWACTPWYESFKQRQYNNKILKAVCFHHELTTMAQRKGQRPFWFSGSIDNTKVEKLISRLNLYSANRLNKKSWQIDNGAMPGIRYYHAALFAESSSTPLDVLYWLKFDENHQIIAGEFIHRALPTCLLCPLDDLRHWAHEQTGPMAELNKEIINLYINSLGVI